MALMISACSSDSKSEKATDKTVWMRRKVCAFVVCMLTKPDGSMHEIFILIASVRRLARAIATPMHKVWMYRKAKSSHWSDIIFYYFINENLFSNYNFFILPLSSMIAIFVIR